VIEFDPFDLPTQNRAENDRRHAVALDRRAEAEDWQWLMTSKKGRRIMRDLIDHCGVARSSFASGNETFYREGKRAVGLYVLRQAWTHAPAACLEMLKDE
jgi:hypothetical protein